MSEEFYCLVHQVSIYMCTCSLPAIERERERVCVFVDSLSL